MLCLCLCKFSHVARYFSFCTFLIWTFSLFVCLLLIWRSVCVCVCVNMCSLQRWEKERGRQKRGSRSIFSGGGLQYSREWSKLPFGVSPSLGILCNLETLQDSLSHTQPLDFLLLTCNISPLDSPCLSSNGSLLKSWLHLNSMYHILFKFNGSTFYVYYIFV